MFKLKGYNFYKILFCFFTFILIALVPDLLIAGSKNTLKAKLRDIFVFEEARWQTLVISEFATFIDYENMERNGKGVAIAGLFRVTRALSVEVEFGYYFFSRVKSPPEDFKERENTQTMRLEGLLRWDFDIIELHPFIAFGGCLYFFPSGNLSKIDSTHWGPNIKVGVDFTLAGRVVWGFVFDHGWILKYSPPPGKDFPTFSQLGVKMGAVF